MLHKTIYTAHMSSITETLKLSFLRLNWAKVEGFTYLQSLNTPVANNILATTKGERHTLTLPQRA
jgi:hypothetical protein